MTLHPASGEGCQRCIWPWAFFDDGGTLSPPLPSLLASSRQVAPDSHMAEAQPLGDLSDGQALLAEEDRLGTVVVGEAVTALQPCLPAQPVDRRAVDAAATGTQCQAHHSHRSAAPPRWWPARCIVAAGTHLLALSHMPRETAWARPHRPPRHPTRQ